MGIGWTLQGANVVNFAKNAGALIPGWLVFKGGVGSDRVFGRFAEV